MIFIHTQRERGRRGSVRGRRCGSVAEGLSHIDYLEFHLPAAEIMMVCLHSDALVHMLHLTAVNGGGGEREEAECPSQWAIR